MMSYNILVGVVQRNIILSDWGDPSHKECLLNLKNRQSRQQTLKNIQLACCLTGQMNLSVSWDEVAETMEYLTNPESHAMARETAFGKCPCPLQGLDHRYKMHFSLPYLHL